MKTPTSELTGAALDWAVAKCERAGVTGIDSDGNIRIAGNSKFNPSIDWALGGLIMERERIGVTPMTVTVGDDRGTRYWFANHEDTPDFQDGPTVLIAAMRCFVASKLGNTVNIPDELAMLGDEA